MSIPKVIGSNIAFCKDFELADKNHAKGSCNCGAVQFTVNINRTSVFVCHCSICRKSTGSSGIAVTVVPTECLKMSGDLNQVQKWIKPNHDWLTHFCKVCGSPLPAKNDNKHSYIPVSLLDCGFEDLQIKHHIFVDSKANWDKISDDGQQHKGAFGA